jgi:hypothetical protein
MTRFEDEEVDDEEMEDEEYDEDEGRDWEDEEYDEDEGRDWEDDDRSMFADPGGNSALRAETRNNPRNLPCPTCGDEDVLTPADVACGYQCNRCADRAEGGY